MATLRLRQLKHLASALGVSTGELRDIIASAQNDYEELLLTDPKKPDKSRVVLSVRGPVRALLRKLYKDVLLPKLVPSAESHGGIRKRDILTNVAPHLGSTFALKVDIADFYPSIHHTRVYRLFADSLECSPDVSRALTRLCTYKHHLALGLVTSPILADQILKRVDRRLAGACLKEGLVYTRFVDDITLSAPFDFDDLRILRIVQSVLSEDGFRLNQAKSTFGHLNGPISITGVRVKRRRTDATKEYVAELDRQLSDVDSLSMGNGFDGPYFTKDQIRGRIQFVCRLNPGRKRDLIRRFKGIRWQLAEDEAARRGLVQRKERLTRIANICRPTQRSDSGMRGDLGDVETPF